MNLRRLISSSDWNQKLELHQRTRGVFLALAALLYAWNPARAQGAPEAPRQELTLLVGVASEARRDDADSPLAYSGAGLGVQLDYDWSRMGRRWYLSVANASATITPTASGLAAKPEEVFASYAMETGTDWRLRGSSAKRGEFALGVELGVTVTVTRHLYANSDLTEQTFDLATATLGPAARWRRRLGPGEIAVSLALPLLAWVDHPYADVRFASQLMDPHFAPLSQFHQANAGLSYAFNPASRYGITAAYRVDIMQLDDSEPVRRVAQSFSIGVVRRFGPAR
jgi:hypothetical protein